MIVDIEYSIVGNHRHRVDLDDYADEIFDTYGMTWEELSDDERDEFIKDLGYLMFGAAESECEYTLGDIEAWEEENGAEHWFK